MSRNSNIAYLALGSNIGNSKKIIEAAIENLNKLSTTILTKTSSIYHTKAIGPVQPDYFNTAVEIKTKLSPLELLNFCQKIEKTLGRKNNKRWHPRIIDIDIILYGNTKLSFEALTIPHPGLLVRPFVFRPILEIAPNCLLPCGELLKEKIITY